MDQKIIASAANTDENGQFNMTIVTIADEYIHKDVIVASMRQQNFSGMQSFAQMGTMMMGGGMMGPGRVMAQGSTPVEYHTGDSVSGIHIIMQSPEESKSVTGNITTEDENWPVPVIVTAQQGNQQIMGQVNPNGSYRIDWLNSGLIKINFHVMMGMGMGIDTNSLYSPETIEIVIPEDQNIVNNVDVILQKLSLIHISEPTRPY